jgi:tRNA threonylcarbamoyladenosine biosynthesis protein TsaE
MEERMVSRGPDETRAIAASLASTLRKGSVLSLHGELGSGKTCFIQGLAEGLGVTQSVASPTYTIINEYSGRLPLYHIDLYRLRGADEALAAGFEDYLESDGITAVEWAERAGELFPPHTIVIIFRLLPDPDSREITIARP